MALHYPADNLLIMDYNRVLRDLHGMTAGQFLAKLYKHFEIEPIEPGQDTRPGGIHKMSLYIDKQWFRLSMRENSIDKSSSATQIDSHLLTSLVLTPMLGIVDIKRDPRIDFVGGMRGHKELEKRCNDDCVAAFAMHPVEFQEVVSVADAGEIMPPKSTWFEPKPRSGFVVRRFKD
jgi:uncharacterized protein (DUF1015 family)